MKDKRSTCKFCNPQTPFKKFTHEPSVFHNTTVYRENFANILFSPSRLLAKSRLGECIFNAISDKNELVGEFKIGRISFRSL